MRPPQPTTGWSMAWAHPPSGHLGPSGCLLRLDSGGCAHAVFRQEQPRGSVLLRLAPGRGGSPLWYGDPATYQRPKGSRALLSATSWRPTFLFCQHACPESMLLQPSGPEGARRSLLCPCPAARVAPRPGLIRAAGNASWELTQLCDLAQVTLSPNLHTPLGACCLYDCVQTSRAANIFYQNARR